MGQAIPTQHPAVVLRSHYENVRALLAVAMIAVIALTSVVVILATDDNNSGVDNPTANVAAPNAVGRGVPPAQAITDVQNAQDAEKALALRSEAMNDIRAARAADFATPQASGPQAPGVRYDGGPEEGTRGAVVQSQPLTSRYDGGPEEGTRGLIVNRSSSPTPTSRYDGGPEEGSHGPFANETAPSSRYDGGPEEGSRGLGH